MIVCITLVFLLKVLAASYCEEHKYEHKSDEFVVTCHSSDFVCFQTQYEYLRDHVTAGSAELPPSRMHHVRYSDTQTCVKLSGVEASRLLAISFEGTNKLFTMIITMPVRFQQVDPLWDGFCQSPDKEFQRKGPHVGPYKKFSCNATIAAQFPFKFTSDNSSQLHMAIESVEIDVTLDVPDLTSYNKSSELERRIYEWSEWAYELVQHVDVPDRLMVPYLRQLKALYSQLPLQRLIMLYPSQKYEDLTFNYVEEDAIL